MRGRAVLGPRIALLATLAADASFIPVAAVAHPVGAREGVVAKIALSPKDSFLQVGKPVKLDLLLENRGAAPATASNAVLFGGGLVIERDGEPPFFVGVQDLPAGAKQELVLPPGASARAVLDLAVLAPAPLAKPGNLRVRVQLAGVANEPLEIELAPDWTGWRAVIETDFGEMEIELFPDRAPRTVANFLGLAQKGFYDGLTFHRIVKGLMGHGGDPKGDGTGNSGRTIPFERTGVAHERGVISMARGKAFDSASCQFFVCHRDVPVLDGNYAAFGRVVRGLETLDRIAAVECSMVPGGPDAVPSRPKERVSIRSIRPVAPPAKSR